MASMRTRLLRSLFNTAAHARASRSVYLGAMIESASRTRWRRSTLALALALALAGACGGKGGGGKAGAGGGGGGGAGGAAGAGAGGSAGGAGTGAAGTTDGGGSDGAAGAPVDAGPLPPSCAGASGPGVASCGTGHESCCASLLVTGGSYGRTYDPADGGAGVDAGSDPATVSDFKLDKYDVTVGRFRQFVKAVLAGDGGAGWRPSAGAGKHAHLGGGLGLLDVGGDAGVAHEPGWSPADDANLAPTDANLASCGATSTWTPTAGAGEDRPINCINWAEAYAFCIWDGGFLPSEAEWEYAAAGGSEMRAFPWGAAAPGTTNQYAIYDCHFPAGSTMCSGDTKNVAPVGSAPMGAGRWGQLDLAGNESTWSLDFYAVSFVSPCMDCSRVTTGSSRIVRGGSFSESVANLQPTYRDANGPTLRNDYIGIRCARSP
jgi:formylglycine-generating enzyme required for sulfatase activity